MLEAQFGVNSDASWLPTAEAMQGAGGLCSSGIAVGNQGGTPYKYLPFAKNGINYASQEGCDVISYNFTGCIMAVFKHKDGTIKVCHVSTGKGQDCKAEWQRIKGESTQVFEFRPSDFVETNGQALSGCYGLITADFKTYAITVTTSKTGQRQIANVKMAHLLRA
jgi:hypothetical protein